MTYTHNAAGDLASVDYSDSTPDVSMQYDRAGRLKSRTDAAGACTWTYHASGQLDSESYVGGILDGFGLDRDFDSLARLSGLSGTSVPSVSFSYDAGSRLDTVTNGTNTATYGYLANSSLIESVTFKNNGSTRLTTTKAYDNLSRLTSITNTPLGAPEPSGGGGSALSASSAFYQYNAANQRTKLTRETSAYWDYGYDPLGQVTSAAKKLPSGEPILGLDHAWTFDDIGNRKTATTNSQISSYSANLLNQYSSRTVPGSIEVLGEAQPEATVTVTFPAPNGTIYPTTRQGALFHRQLAVDNTLGAQFPSLTITGVRNNAGPNGEDAVTEETKSTLIPKTPEAYIHDADGNLREDARWSYTWDGENRLIAMESTGTLVSAGAPQRRLEFAYDGQSRRIAKKVYAWETTSGSWILDSSILFLYDGCNLIAELDALSSNTLARTYAWGLDLSGSLQGASGVGGLLFANTSTAPGSPLTAHTPAYDGNGNVIAYVDLATGAKSATYEYGAFGETLIADGVAADAMPFRFSTKYTDSETGLIYYGYRFFKDGRFLNRDPIEEQGGVNVYGFVRNDPLNNWDLLGLTEAYAELTQADRAEIQRRFYDVLFSYEALTKRWYSGPGAVILIDGEAAMAFGLLSEEFRSGCKKTGKLLVKKKANRSRYVESRIPGPWRLVMPVDAVSNYFGFNVGKSVWQRNVRENYRSLDHWHILEEYECCKPIWPQSGEGPFKNYFGKVVIRLRGAQTESKWNIEQGYGSSVMDGINFNRHVTPPRDGFAEDPGPQTPTPPAPPSW